MRARYPDSDGFVDRNGAKVYYEVYENEGPTILLAQTWQTCHSRHWKMQIPYLSRHFRVVTYDPVGNGNSDRSSVVERYTTKEVIADAIAVLDATETESCVAAGLSMGGGLVTLFAAFHPERFDGIVPISPGHPWGIPLPDRESIPDQMFEPVSNPEGWEKYNLGHWRADWPDFVDFFFGQCTSDPHSTKLFDDMVGWALNPTLTLYDTDGSTLLVSPDFGNPFYMASANDVDDTAFLHSSFSLLGAGFMMTCCYAHKK